MAEVQIAQESPLLLSETEAASCGWKGWVRRFVEALLTLEKTLLYLSLYAMCLGAIAQWPLRAFFEISLNWVNEGTTFAMLWAGFLGASIASSRLEHFQIDLVRFVKEPLRGWIRALSYLIAALFFIIFAYASFGYIGMLIRYHETSHFYDYPIWPIYTVVAYFYLSSALKFFLAALLRIF